jgi:D-alanyl-lipoteichoic acid acyltransferase DltB (MBOAT superfamily)
MRQPDRLYGVVQPLNDAFAVFLKEHLWPARAVGATAGLLGVVELSVLVVVLCCVCAGLRPAPRESGGPARRSAWSAISFGIAALTAIAIFAWSVRIGGGDITSIFGRWDHIVFCGAAGCALGYLPPRWRRCALSAVSLYFLVGHAGPRPLGVLVAAGLLGFILLRLPDGQRPWLTALLQGFVLLGLFAVIWKMRTQNLFEALRAQGGFGFLLLRHISFVVEVRRGRPAGLLNYLCYMFFYPCFFGASEIYSEFHERNLKDVARYDYRAAAYKIIVGQLAVWASFQIDVSFDRVIQTHEPLMLWWNVLWLFLRSGLFVMGLWSTIEGLALLYGIELRPNFAGVLTCLNPAQFWRSWRATMTNWLIHYVYIPLGGNRHHQLRNICAAFVVSTAWHWMGIPFFTVSPRWWDFAPITLWGIINAAGVTGYVAWRRLGATVLPAGTPQIVRSAAKGALTFCFATFTVTLLSFRPDNMQHFAPFLRTLLGLLAP